MKDLGWNRSAICIFCIQRTDFGRSSISNSNTLIQVKHNKWPLVVRSDASYTWCSAKVAFFHYSLQPPSLAYIAVRGLQRSQRNASVQSLLLAGILFGGKLSRILGKKTKIFNEHPVYVSLCFPSPNLMTEKDWETEEIGLPVL